MKRIAIVNGVRTPFVKAWDAFDNIPAQQLGAMCVTELLQRTELDGRLIDEVVMGCAGQPAEAKEPPKQLMIAQLLPVDDALVGRLRNQVYARDLVFEKVDDATPGDKKEKAVYVANPTGSPESRLIADVTLKHQ